MVAEAGVGKELKEDTNRFRQTVGQLRRGRQDFVKADFRSGELLTSTTNTLEQDGVF